MPSEPNLPVIAAMGLDPRPTGEDVGKFLFRVGPLLDKTEIGLYISELGRIHCWAFPK